jgi:hypothetical protein
MDEDAMIIDIIVGIAADVMTPINEQHALT